MSGLVFSLLLLNVHFFVQQSICISIRAEGVLGFITAVGRGASESGETNAGVGAENLTNLFFVSPLKDSP